MWKRLGLLMKQQIQLPCFGSTLKVCVAFIILMSASSLACRGRGSGGGGSWRPPPRKPAPAAAADDGIIYNDWEAYLNATGNQSLQVAELDEELVVNLTGVKGPVDRNTASAWRGWKPANSTKKDWDEWYDKYAEQNEKDGEITWKRTPKKEKKDKKDKKGKKGKKGAGGPGGAGRPGGAGGSGGTGGPGGAGGPGGNQTSKPKKDYSAERGPETGWPRLSGWSDLGAGNGGTPIPPWAYTPKNVNKPSICYLPPIEGSCHDTPERHKPEKRWGYNPFTDLCEQYLYSGCGGTRNNFVLKPQCERRCEHHAPPSCSHFSGFKEIAPPKRG